MVDSKLLNQKIEESGLKKTYLASQIGITRAGFYKKLNNLSEFTTGEVASLCKLLSITNLSEKESIFFVNEVN